MTGKYPVRYYLFKKLPDSSNFLRLLLFWDKREYSITVAYRLDSACSWLDMYT
jgi:hypothetical protein